MMPMPLGMPEVALRLGLAAVLGGLIGLERDIHGRAAGLRTHLLVSLGSAVFMVLSVFVARSGQGGTFVADPGRIAAQVIAGIGFLGAGVIIKERATVRGLTTSACLWLVAGVGMAAGAGYPQVAVVTTAFALVGLVVLKAFERLYPKDYYRTIEITTGIGVSAADIIALMKAQKLTILSCGIKRDYVTRTSRITLGLRFFHKGVTDKRSHELFEVLEKSGLEIQRIEWRRL
ncbi:MAG: MgtC/SapB family protein [bacterium]|nr:MgtC/SapB family protein [bacterium]